MKVLHVNCNYIGTTLHQLMVEELERNGYDNFVYVPTYNRNLAVITPNENVVVSECFKKWDRLICFVGLTNNRNNDFCALVFTSDILQQA